MVFCVPGTAVHEASHAFFCLLFGHKIDHVKWFDRDSESTTPGFVAASHQSNSHYARIGNLFIGLGPLLFGPLIIAASAWLFFEGKIFDSSFSDELTLSSDLSVVAVRSFLIALFEGAIDAFSKLATNENFSRWQFYLFLYVAFVVGGSIRLSKPDMMIAGSGAVHILLLLLIFILATLWLGNFISLAFGYLQGLFSLVYSIMIFAIGVNIIFFVGLAPTALIFERFRT